MSGIDIAALAGKVSEKGTPQDVLSFLDEANKAISKIDGIVSTLQKWGISPAIVEKFAIKYGELDKVAALPDQNRGIIPASTAHKAIFEKMNTMTEEQLAELLKPKTQ